MISGMHIKLTGKRGSAVTLGLKLTAQSSTALVLPRIRHICSTQEQAVPAGRPIDAAVGAPAAGGEQVSAAQCRGMGKAAG